MRVHVRKDDGIFRAIGNAALIDRKVSMKMLMSCWLGRGELREILLFFFTATLARFDRENNRVCRATQLRESRECLFVRQRHDFSEEMRRAIGINSRIVIKILRILSVKIGKIEINK